MNYTNYMGIFGTSGDVQTALVKSDLYKPYVALVDDEIDWNSIDYDPKEEPFTFKILTDGNIIWKAHSTIARTPISYSKNGGAWTSVLAQPNGVTIPVLAGDIIVFSGNNTSYSYSYNNSSYFNSDCLFRVKGNIMSLLNNASAFTKDNVFANLFSGCTGLTDASELNLSLTELRNGCYRGMFNGCTSLVKTPDLPATTLAQSCYYQMFNGCTSLVNAPELPATTLEGECYKEMFKNCTSLVKAPALPATDVVDTCYVRMFAGCTGLVNAPEISATTLSGHTDRNSEGPFQYMFEDCTSLANAPELNIENINTYDYNTTYYGMYCGMFKGCTSLKTAPELTGTTLGAGCYMYMFSGCTNLNYIKCLATDISAANCTKDWVRGVQINSGTFVKNPNMSSWGTGNSGVPTRWTVVDAS